MPTPNFSRCSTGGILLVWRLGGSNSQRLISAAGTNDARWYFRENPDRKDGIGPEQMLGFTVPHRGILRAQLHVSARLIRPGLGGQLDAIRDLIMGPQLQGFGQSVQFEIPMT